MSAVKRLCALLLCVWWVGCGAQPPASALPSLVSTNPEKDIPALARMHATLMQAKTGATVKLSSLFRCLDCGKPQPRCSKMHQCGKGKNGKDVIKYTRSDPINLRRAYNELLAAGAKAVAENTA